MKRRTILFALSRGLGGGLRYPLPVDQAGGVGPRRHQGGHGRPLAEDIWELYDTRNDFSLVNELSAKFPQKLKEMQALFMKEAEKNQVLPIDDRVFERNHAGIVHLIFVDKTSNKRCQECLDEDG